jgi:superfamily II DNA or RNA helicase
MARALITADANSVRAVIARRWLMAEEETSSLGTIVLRPHQRDAVARARVSIARFGGVLLADEVGLGKTYTALAIARQARHLVVVAPAGLRDMWRQALVAAGLSGRLVSIESLSRATHLPADATDADMVVIDEAHHLRNPATRRYRATALLVRQASVVLLSATPVHNTSRDLAAVLALFLGSRALALDASELAQCIVRRGQQSLGGGLLPTVAAPRPLRVETDEALLEALIALPPPVPPRDGDDGGALVLFSLVRQWASSDGALRSALRRRRNRACAMLDMLAAGRSPSRTELAAWRAGDDAVQLAFPDLVADGPRTIVSSELSDSVRAHVDGVERLLALLDRAPNHDAERAARIREVRVAHDGERIVAFSQFDDTVRALFNELRADPRVAVLSARGARVAGGQLSRREALARFVPRALGVRPPPAAEAIELLLTTDLLSEGVSLTDASVVIHLDLPWTIARLEQRVGRLARLGSPHREIAVYAMQPPARSEIVLRVEERLVEKARAARCSIGRSSIPVFGADDQVTTLQQFVAENSVAELTEGIRATLKAWLGSSDALELPGEDPGSEQLLVAACRSQRCGFIALMEEADGTKLLVALDGGHPSADPAAVRTALASAGGQDISPNASRVEYALAAVERWRADQKAAADAGARSGIAPPRRRVLRRIASTVAQARPDRRPAFAALGASARKIVARLRSAGFELLLGELADEPMESEAWLRAVIALDGGPSANESAHTVAQLPLLRCRALLLLESLDPAAALNSPEPSLPLDDR